MANEQKSKFRDRIKSYRLKKLREKKEKYDLNHADAEEKNEEHNIVKLVIFSPLIGAGYLKKGIDHVYNDEDYNRILDGTNNVLLDNPKTYYNKLILSNNELNDKKSNSIIFFQSNNLNKSNENDFNNKGTNNIISEVKYINRLKNINILDEKVIINTSNSNDNIDNYNFVYANNEKFIKAESDLEKSKKSVLKRITKKIKKDKNEIEALKSNLNYLIEKNNDNIYKDECEEILGKIKVIYEKIVKLKNQYQELDVDSELDDILLLDNDLIIEDLINYKNLCLTLQQKKDMSKSFKDLDGFISQFDELKDIERETSDIYINTEKLLQKYKIRDEKFNLFKEKREMLGNQENKISFKIKEQEQKLNELVENISKIDKNVNVTYRLNGLSNLLLESVKYLGLISLFPLRGVIPSITRNTLITRNIIRNLRENIKLEKKEEVRYSAKDYEIYINNSIDNLDKTNYLINDALLDIQRLKKEFREEFEMYKDKIPEYDQSIKRINIIEKDILNNKKKLQNIKKSMEDNKNINTEKMKKVKKLNDSQ